MNSKNNNKDRNDSPSTSSSPQSPYNLRRNQLQAGAVSKRSNSAKSKKNVSIATAPTQNLNANSTNSQSASDPIEVTSHDNQHLSENNDTNEMERSEDEEEVTILKQQADRQTNKLTSVWSYFDYLSDNFYMCLICLKVRI